MRQCSSTNHHQQQHQPTCLVIKQFALFASIYALASAALALTSITNLQDTVAELNRTMENYAKDYLWDLKPDELPNDATRTWDIFQRGLNCCGLRGPEDWNRWSGRGVVLPKSCCHTEPLELPVSRELNKCRGREASGGCIQQVKAFILTCFFADIMLSGFLLLLAAIALLVAKQAEPDKAGPQSERFKGSIFLHQTPSNEAHNGTHEALDSSQTTS